MKKLFCAVLAILLVVLLPLTSLAVTPVECTVCPGDDEVFYSVTHFVPNNVSMSVSKYSFTSTNGKIFEGGLYRGTLVSQAVYQSGSRVGTNYFYQVGIKGLSAGQATLNLLYDGEVIASYNITIGHDWDTASYVWSDDLSSVTATRHCGRNPEHDVTETVKTTSKVKTEATEKKEGILLYTAVFTNDAFTTQTKEVAIPKLPAGTGSNPGSGTEEQITLKKISIKKVTAASKSKLTVTWKKLSSADRKKIKKIEVQISTDKKFRKNVITKTVSSGKTSVAISKLKPGQKYYVRIRAFTKSGKNIYVSKWSSVKNIKTKKK